MNEREEKEGLGCWNLIGYIDTFIRSLSDATSIDVREGYVLVNGEFWLLENFFWKTFKIVWTPRKLCSTEG